MDEARRVSSRERANQSNQDVKQPLSSPTAKERGTMSPAGIEPTASSAEIDEALRLLHGLKMANHTIESSDGPPVQRWFFVCEGAN